MGLALVFLSDITLYFQRDFKFKSFIYIIVIMTSTWPQLKEK